MRGLRNLFGAIVLTTGYAQAETVVIAALGDSLTAGYGLPTEDGMVSQLQGWLVAQGIDTEIRNAGVSGDTTAGGLSRVDWTLTPDVDAMIVALGGNDYLRGIDPAVSRDNLRAILEKAAAAKVDVLLVGLQGGNNYGLDYKAAFEGMYPELAAEFGVMLYPSFFAALMDVAGSQENMRNYIQPDGVHPNAEGVAIIVDAIGPAVQELALQAQD